VLENSWSSVQEREFDEEHESERAIFGISDSYELY